MPCHASAESQIIPVPAKDAGRTGCHVVMYIVIVIIPCSMTGSSAAEFSRSQTDVCSFLNFTARLNSQLAISLATPFDCPRLFSICYVASVDLALVFLPIHSSNDLHCLILILPILLPLLLLDFPSLLSFSFSSHFRMRWVRLKCMSSQLLLDFSSNYSVSSIVQGTEPLRSS